MGFAGDENLFAAAEFERRFCLRAVDGDVALIEEQLHARTADAFKLRGDEVIEALARGFGWDCDGARGSAMGWPFDVRMGRIATVDGGEWRTAMRCDGRFEQNECSGEHEERWRRLADP